jgi:hypothetical protein
MNRLVYDVSTGEQMSVPLSSEETAERTTIAATEQARQTSADAFRTQISALAQTAVGVRLQDLTQAQIKALMAILLYESGGVDPATLQVRPLEQWAG